MNSKLENYIPRCLKDCEKWNDTYIKQLRLMYGKEVDTKEDNDEN
ncbi:hypothetical protein [uncultured Megamonas sp.]|nr:hypothetical protein [uncultured Megamonas sp.]